MMGFWKRLFSLFYSIYFNFRYLPIKEARKIPILISWDTMCRIKGKIIIQNSDIRFGMIHLGVAGGSYGKGRGLKNSLIVKEGAYLRFSGICHIASGFSINVEENAQLVIGKDFSANYNLTISVETDIDIHDSVLIGWNCTIIDADGHDILNKEKTIINKASKIEIREHVWIASNVSILKGTYLAKDSVVGYGAVICDSFEEPSCVIVGVPGKVAKRDIEWKM